MLGTEIGLLVYSIVVTGGLVFLYIINEKLKKLNEMNVKLVAELSTKVYKLEGQIVANKVTKKRKTTKTNK